MKAIVVREWRDPPAFPMEDVPTPNYGADEILVRVHTAAITFGDMLIATGGYQVKPSLPFTPGTECSGIIEAVGAEVQGFAPGDHVSCIGFIGKSREEQRIVGSYREYTVVPARNMVKVPKHIDLERAALFRSNAETSYFGLQEGKLQAGETLLVLGAGGGTGYAAVQIGKLLGARVIASASSQAKRDIALAGGADIAIDSNAPDWRDQVSAFAGERGVNVVYDPVGGDIADRAFRTLGYQGRYLVIGFAAGAIPKLALNLPLMKGSSIVGANMLRAWEAEPERIAANARRVMELFAEGKLDAPPVARRYTLEQAADALADVASGKTAGRIVINVARDQSAIAAE